MCLKLTPFIIPIPNGDDKNMPTNKPSMNETIQLT